MTYVPLARRLRPRVFADVVGQDATVRILQSAIRLDRIVTSYVFSGPPGSGKTSVARLLAAGLNCQGLDRLCGVCGAPQFVAYENGVRCGETCRNGHGGAASVDGAGRPCGACPSCLDVQEGRHPLVHEIDAASDRGVEMVENLQTLVSLVLAPTAWRIFVLDEAHQLSAKAWAAFLKTIEEPAPRNVFVFVTTEREKVIETVLSRSSTFIFRPVTNEAIVQVLAAASRDEQLDPSWRGEYMTPDILAAIAREAQGSVRDALHLLDKVALLGPTNITEVERLIGIDSETVRDVADALISFDLCYFVNTLDSVLARGFTPAEVADLVLRICRDIVVFRTGFRGLSVSGLPADRLVQNTERIGGDVIQRLYNGAVWAVESRRVDRITLETMYVRVVRGIENVDTCTVRR